MLSYVQVPRALRGAGSNPDDHITLTDVNSIAARDLTLLNTCKGIQLAWSMITPSVVTSTGEIYLPNDR